MFFTLSIVIFIVDKLYVPVLLNKLSVVPDTNYYSDFYLGFVYFTCALFIAGPFINSPFSLNREP